ncbi:dihydropteroate synthase [Litoreibacter roseus]|uniref:Dihydropteroate synthase n=2 Tax=Litoreibacter roseus TaxID=2601869 RepID=A0A6N6JJ26_9RHOB|nr:dihydropteroate synthase [Litoreibacter roseus]GFE65957.1 dihydropteroate synthase [Litoreibacter roseus]
MTSYFRPLVQTDAARPADALPLAGTSFWFTHAERRLRGAVPELVPVSEIPPDTLEKLCSARAPLCDLSMKTPRLMGVLNVTPDSFSDGGAFDNADVAAVRAAEMVAEGADILDIGGESTRPGADYVTEEDEIGRIAPVLDALYTAGVTTPISIDTRKAGVAEAAFAKGAAILNDVSALTFDPEMAQVAARLGGPVCLMHAQGDPATMQDAPRYDDVLLDVFDFLAARIDDAVAAGVARDRIILDPGIGFGKTQAHNLALLKGLSLFHGLGCPILLGVSRKGFIGKIGDEPDAARRAPGSIAVGLEALRQGVQILRVHDIKAHKQAIALWQALHG